MEPKPKGLPELEYIARREQLGIELSPQAWAIYQFIENAWRMERQDPNQPRHEFKFEFNRTPEIVLTDVFDGFEDVLPVLPMNSPEHKTMIWSMEDPNSHEYDHIDMEIHFKEEEIEFVSKNRNLSMVLPQWYQLVNGIDYPITARDQSSTYGQPLEGTALRGLGPDEG